MKSQNYILFILFGFFIPFIVCLSQWKRYYRVMESIKFAGHRVFGAIIVTDPDQASLMIKNLHKHKNQTVDPILLEKYALKIGNERMEHAKELASQLPFPLSFWSSLVVGPCPSSRPDTPASNRGVTFSHYQIWHDFVFQQRSRVFGTTDNDLLIVFEDDAQIAVQNITFLLQKELSSFKGDLLLLGWCYRYYGKFGYCAHSYALKRSGAKKLMGNIDFCGPPIEIQYGSLRNFTISFPSKEYERYINLPEYSTLTTQGLFVQKKGMTSVNTFGKTN